MHVANLNNLFTPENEIPDDAFPPRFEEALEQIQELNSRCQQAQIPEATQISALMVELMPRLVQAYGPEGVIAMFNQLITEIGGAQLSSGTKNDSPRPSPHNDLPN